MKRKTNIANKANYGGQRPTSSICWIVIHYTANDGDTDEANANYFKNNVVVASAHYFVDDDSVTQSVPDDYIAYSVGGTKWGDCAETGGGKFYGVCRNANSISIEMCDTKRDGTIMASDKTIENTVTLVKELMEKYNIKADHVIRHFDVNGKHCPAYFMNEKVWKKFKDKLTTTKETKKEETKKVETKKKETKKEETKKEETKKADSKEFKVKVDISNLNIRKGPASSYDSVGFIDPGTYTIVETKGTWGKLKSGKGWISMNYVKKV